jgi:hypothetical protein
MPWLLCRLCDLGIRYRSLASMYAGVIDETGFHDPRCYNFEVGYTPDCELENPTGDDDLERHQRSYYTRNVGECANGRHRECNQLRSNSTKKHHQHHQIQLIMKMSIHTRHLVECPYMQ